MMSRLALLDLTRLFAALMVVLYHYTAWNHGNWGPSQNAEAWPLLSQVTVFGNLGVQLFFIISGFVIMLSSYGKKPSEFIGSRVGRLYPAYWVGVIATGVLVFFLWDVAEGITYADWAANLTMVQSAFGIPHVDGVYWTLWVELRFYALILVLLFLGWVTPGRMLLFAGAWPAAAVLADGLGLDGLADVLMKQHAPLFAGGIVLFLLYRFGYTPLRWIVLGLNVALSAFFTGRRASGEVADLADAVIAPETYWPLVVGLFALVALVTLTRASTWTVPGSRAAGALTYPVYVLHQVWGWWLISIFAPVLPRPAALIAVVVLILAASWTVHRYVERPVGRPMARAVARAMERAGLDRLGERVSAAGATLRPDRLRRIG